MFQAESFFLITLSLILLQFFTHPAVHSEMSRKWGGREFMESEWNPWQQLLFSIWCLFDLLFSPILLAVFSLLKNKWKGTSVASFNT